MRVKPLWFGFDPKRVFMVAQSRLHNMVALTYGPMNFFGRFKRAGKPSWPTVVKTVWQVEDFP
jgi:hypothetical protein